MTKSSPLGALVCLAPAAAVLGMLSGCGTPQAALDQANATAGLATRYDIELAAFRKSAAAVAEARLASIRRQEALIADLAESDAWNLRTARLAGLGDAAQRRQQLIDLAATRAADAEATRQRLAELDAQLGALVAPLPKSTPKLTVLQKALAEIGTELPTGERLKLALDAVATVRDEVKKNHEAAQAVTAATPAASVPAGPAPAASKEAQP